MRKIYNILIVLMMILSISSLALADNPGKHNGRGNNTKEQINVNGQNKTDENQTLEHLDNETKEEIQVMNNSLGTEIRLLQLEKAITRNIIIGNMTIEVLKGLNTNTTSLELILNELKTVLKEVKAINASSNDSVKIFVELKNESKNLTSQFREEVKKLLTDEKITEIKDRIREIVNESLQNLTHIIKIKIRQFNREQIYMLYGIIGEANSSFVNEYLNGNITLGQVKNHFYKTINHMTKEQRYDAFSKMKEDNIRRDIHSRDKFEHHGDNNKGKGS